MHGLMAEMGLWMLFWALLALVLLAAAVLGIVALARHLSTPSTPGTQPGWQPDETVPPRPPERTPP
jgi:hypothetical protein